MTKKPDISARLQREMRQALRDHYPTATDEQIDATMVELNRITDKFVSKQRRAERAKLEETQCLACGHGWGEHGGEDGRLPGRPCCMVYMGMGEPCGCDRVPKK